MIQLVEGECHCISSARILLRRCGYMPGKDYEEINRRLVKESNLFKEHPELYNTVCMVLYDPQTGLFIDLHNKKYTVELKSSVDALMACAK